MAASAGTVARRTLTNALRKDNTTLQASLRSATRSFTTRATRWETNGTTIQCRTPLQSHFPLHNGIPAFARARRRFSATPIAKHDVLMPPKPGQELKITFVTKEGDRHTFDVKAGDNLLDIALDNDLEMEGACGGSCACSTCHVIVEDDKFYDKIEEPGDDENDMLDLAFGLTETSRLGCQVQMTKELDGLVVKLPSMTRNLQASDFES